LSLFFLSLFTWACLAMAARVFAFVYAGDPFAEHLLMFCLLAGVAAGVFLRPKLKRAHAAGLGSLGVLGAASALVWTSASLASPGALVDWAGVPAGLWLTGASALLIGLAAAPGERGSGLPAHKPWSRLISGAFFGNLLAVYLLLPKTGLVVGGLFCAFGLLLSLLTRIDATQAGIGQAPVRIRSPFGQFEAFVIGSIAAFVLLALIRAAPEYWNAGQGPREGLVSLFLLPVLLGLMATRQFSRSRTAAFPGAGVGLALLATVLLSWWANNLFSEFAAAIESDLGSLDLSSILMWRMAQWVTVFLPPGLVLGLALGWLADKAGRKDQRPDLAVGLALGLLMGLALGTGLLHSLPEIRLLWVLALIGVGATSLFTITAKRNQGRSFAVGLAVLIAPILLVSSIWHTTFPAPHIERADIIDNGAFVGYRRLDEMGRSKRVRYGRASLTSGTLLYEAEQNIGRLAGAGQVERLERVFSRNPQDPQPQGPSLWQELCAGGETFDLISLQFDWPTSYYERVYLSTRFLRLLRIRLNRGGVLHLALPPGAWPRIEAGLHKHFAYVKVFRLSKRKVHLMASAAELKVDPARLSANLARDETAASVARLLAIEGAQDLRQILNNRPTAAGTGAPR
jgi:hypothetical protein